MENSFKSIKEELAEKGIDQTLFTVFYSDLKERQALPPENIAVSTEKYQQVLDYFKEKGVLSSDNQIQPDGLALFEERKNLEEKLFSEVENFGNYRRRRRYKDTGGGIAPCLFDENNLGDPRGGIAPCSDYDDDDWL